MSQFDVHLIRSLGEFQLYEKQWNELYRRSPQHQATGQHALVAAYWESFLADQSVEIACLLDSDTEELVAVLPLSKHRIMRMLACGKNFSNDWCLGFAGLALPDSNLKLIPHLLGSPQLSGYRWLSLDMVSAENHLVDRIFDLSAAGVCHTNKVELFRVGKTELTPTWEDFTQDWSKKRRRFIRRATERLNDVGSYRMRPIHVESLSEVQAAWKQCLELESRGWKGQAQTSIAANPAASNYYEKLVKTLHGTGELRFYVLELNGDVIAYDLGYLHQRVVTSLKVSYHPDYVEYSPGHVLNSHVIQDLIAKQEADWIDTVGELNEANAKWCRTSYQCLKIEVAMGGWIGNTVVKSRDWMRTLKRQFSRSRVAATQTLTTTEK